MTKQVQISEDSKIVLNLKTFAWVLGILITFISSGIGYVWKQVDDERSKDRTEYAKKFKEKDIQYEELEKLFNKYIITIHRDVGVLMERTSNQYRPVESAPSVIPTPPTIITPPTTDSTSIP